MRSGRLRFDAIDAVPLAERYATLAAAWDRLITQLTARGHRQSIALVDAELGDTTIVNERGVNPTDAECAALKKFPNENAARAGASRQAR